MNADLGTVTSPWTLDGEGYLLTPAGVQKMRVDSHGTIHIDIKPQAGEEIQDHDR